MSPEDLASLPAQEQKKMMRKQNMMQLFSRPSELSSSAAQTVLKKYCKAVIVRNPFSRAASAYLHKFRNGNAAQKFGLPSNLSFAGFCDYLRDGGLHDDIHWMPQSHICPLPPGTMDFIGKMENLAIDLPRLTNIVYGRSATIFTRQHHTTQANNHLRELYGTHEKRRVAELYAEDFTCFGYQPDKLS